MSMSRKKCCVPGCMESGGSHSTLHLFPNPAKDRERFNKWVLTIGGNIIGLGNEDIYKHRSVCHVHFEEKFCCRNNRLSNVAVPTLNLPGPLSLPNFPYEERRPMRQRQNDSLSTPTTTSPDTSSASKVVPSFPACSTSATLHTEESQTNIVEKENTDPIPKQIVAAKKGSQPETVISKGQVTKRATYITKTVKKHAKLTLAEHKLYQKLVQARIKLSKCRNKVKKQSVSLKAAKNIMNNPALLASMENMSTTAQVITMMQFREVKKKNKGRRFSLMEKILALSILKQSPKGYRFLRKLLILPAPQTLVKIISQANLKPGINKKIFKQLKNVTKNMKDEEKICIIMFDEVALTPSLTYNEKKDKVLGFVTDGQETKPEFADHAQVYMIRGLIKNYKQPVAYTFSSAATSGQQIAKQLKEVVTELQEAGLIVVATVCDQGANNRLAIKLLIQETRGIYLKKGEEPKENIILVNNREIIPLYDPPHLIKCIRNNLLTKNLEYIANGNKFIAKWEHLILLYHENPGYKGVRLIPKFTENYVLPEKVARNKMKVKFATQTFSRTVATNMGYLAGKGIIPKECHETADMLLFFDNLFDSLNGSYNKKKQKFSKPLLGPVTPTSPHINQWIEAKQKLKNMKFVNTTTGKAENVPTLYNWAWTLNGTQILIKKLERDFKINSVWMRHLNQDPPENFFGAIRSHGCRNTNPTPEKFEGAFATLLINNISSVHAPVGANCEEDFCKNLHALIITDDCKATPTEPCDFEKIDNITIEDVEQKTDPRIKAPLQYISGYFVKNVKTRVFKSCQQCASDLIANEALEYIKYREYTNQQWLCSPTNSVVQIISAVQDISYQLMKESLETNNTKELIKTYVLIFLEFNFLNCHAHKEDVIKCLLNISSRFFIHNYCKDINRILRGKSDCTDDEDRFKVKAKKYFKKCFKRKVNIHN